MRKRFLIIGGSSYIGNNLGKVFEKNHDLYVTYNNSLIENIYKNLVKVDLLDDDPFRNLTNEKPFDCVIWCAQANKYSQDLKNYRDLMNINVMGLQKALDFCVLNKSKKFVYLSTGSVYNIKKEQKLTENSEEF